MGGSKKGELRILAANIIEKIGLGRGHERNVGHERSGRHEKPARITESSRLVNDNGESKERLTRDHA